MNMEQVHVRSLSDGIRVVGGTPTTAGFWYYAGFYFASPAMLAERKAHAT
jgi:hypothetical protein